MAKKVETKAEEVVEAKEAKEVVEEPVVEEEVVIVTSAKKAIAKLIKDNGLEDRVFYTKVFDDGRVAVVDATGKKYYATT